MKVTSSNNNQNQEVVINANPEQLEMLGKWILEQSVVMKKNLNQYSHEHVKGHIKNWHKNWPDIIIYNSRAS